MPAANLLTRPWPFLKGGVAAAPGYAHGDEARSLTCHHRREKRIKKVRETTTTATTTTTTTTTAIEEEEKRKKKKKKKEKRRRKKKGFIGSEGSHLIIISSKYVCFHRRWKTGGERGSPLRRERTHLQRERGDEGGDDGDTVSGQ